MAEDESAKISFVEWADDEERSFVQNYFKRGAVQQTYLARNKVLHKFVNHENVNDMKVLDCSSLTTNYVIKHIVAPIWPSIVREESCQCDTIKKGVDFLDIASGIFEQKNQFDLSPSIINCDTCYESKQIVDVFNNIVYIDTVQAHTINFEEIPKAICLNNSVFCLIALVVEVSSCDGSKHFISHVKRGNNWYVFDNTSNAVAKSKIEKKNIKPHLLVYSKHYLKVTNELMIGNLDDIKVLKNFHEVTESEKKFRLINVCGPDSFFHAFICLYVEFPHLFKKIRTDEKILLFLNAYAQKDMKTVYKYRLDLLKNIFPIKIKQFFEINCDSNAYNVVKDLFMHLFPTAVMKCSCSSSFLIPFVDINYDHLFRQGLKNLQNCLYKTHRKCEKCKIEMNIEYQNILFIDIQPLNGKAIINQIHEFPTEIQLENSLLQLKSIIEYCNGHYVAHCHRKDNTWYRFDDLSETVSISQRAQYIVPHILIYIKP